MPNENLAMMDDIEAHGPAQAPDRQFPRWLVNFANSLKRTLIAEAHGFALSSTGSSVLNNFLLGFPSVDIRRPLAMIASPGIGLLTSGLSVLRQMEVPRTEGPDRAMQAATVGVSGADFLMLLLSQIITSSIRASQSHMAGHHGPYQNSSQFTEALFNSSCASLFHGINSTLGHAGSLQEFNRSGSGFVLPVCEPDWAAALENTLAVSIGLLWSVQFYCMQQNARCPDAPLSRMNQILTHKALLTLSAGLGGASVAHGVTYLAEAMLGNPANTLESSIRYAITGLGLLSGGFFYNNKRFEILSQGISMAAILISWIGTYFLSPEAKEVYGEDVIDEQAIFWSLLPMLLMTIQLAGPSLWHGAINCLNHPVLEGELTPLISINADFDGLPVPVTDHGVPFGLDSDPGFSASDEEDEDTFSDSGESGESSGLDDGLSSPGAARQPGNNRYRMFSSVQAFVEPDKKPNASRRLSL